MSRSLLRTSVQFSNGRLGGHDQAVAFIRRADHVEQQFGSDLAGGDVAELIEDQQVQFRELFTKPQQHTFFAGFHQLRDQLCDLIEAHATTLTAGRDSQCGGDMRFFRARIPDEQNVLPLVDVLAQGQRALWEGEAEWRAGAFGLCLLEALTCVSV